MSAAASAATTSAPALNRSPKRRSTTASSLFFGRRTSAVSVPSSRASSYVYATCVCYGATSMSYVSSAPSMLARAMFSASKFGPVKLIRSRTRVE